MGEFFGVIVVVLLFMVVRAAIGVGGRSYGWLSRRGTPARGILLQVDSAAIPVEGMSSSGIQRRGVTIDVEIPGQAPYTVTTNVFIPRNFARDVLPGATVELRVDPRNQNSVAIIGPGSGFAASALVDQNSAPPFGGAARSG